MPVLTSAQVATLQKTLAVTNNVLPRLEMLEALANINMGMKPRVQELRAQREYLAQLATAALEIERQLGGAVTPTPVQTTAGVAWQPPPMAYPQPAPAPSGFAPMNTAPYDPTREPTGVPGPTTSVQRRFIRSSPILDPAEETLYRQQGWNLEYEPGVGWWAVRR